MSRSHSPRTIRTVLALSAVAITMITLSGCAEFSEAMTHQKELTFADWAAAPTRGDLAFVPAPFVPHDATDLTIKTITTGTGKLLRFTTKSELDPELCEPGPLNGSPRLGADWWPKDAPRSGEVCGHYRVFEKGDVTYAYNR